MSLRWTVLPSCSGPLLFLLLLVPSGFCEIYILDHVGPASQIIKVNDMEAEFGQSIPMNGIHGRLVEASPLNGCHPMDPAPVAHEKHNNSMIAVIAR